MIQLFNLIGPISNLRICRKFEILFVVCDDVSIFSFGFQVITRESAHVAGVGEIYDRVHVELIGKMKEMRMVHFVFLKTRWEDREV